MNIEVRELQVRDVFTIARALAKVTKEARLELASMLSAKKSNPTEIGMVLFQSVFTAAEEDLKNWLASMINAKREEFEEMPAMALLDIIEELSKKEGIRDFFGRASSLVAKISTKG